MGGLAGIRSGSQGGAVNDAPPLAQANLSMTAASGTDVAGEMSDVVLTHLDLTQVSWFVRLSHRTCQIIRQNLGWTLAYNLLVVPLATLRIISPVIVAVTTVTSSVLFMDNSLWLHP